MQRLLVSLACFFFSTAADAESKGRLKPFLNEVESNLGEVRGGVAQLDQQYERGLASYVKIRENFPVEEMNDLTGAATTALAPLERELDDEKSCRLPSAGTRAATYASLAVLQNRAHDITRELPRLKGMSRELYAQTRARFLVYSNQIGELRSWLASPRVDGLTSELIARHPECAGKVTTERGLFWRTEEVAQAGKRGDSGAAKAKLRFDLDVYQLSPDSEAGAE